MGILHTSFYKQPSQTSTALHQHETRASVSFLHKFEFCTCSHFFINLAITHKPFPINGISEGSKEMETQRSIIWVDWWVGKKSPSFPTASYVFKLVCVAITCHAKEGYQQHFCKSNSPEMLQQGFKSLNVQT